jgi:uncharacterized protein (DUF2147 family)
MKKLTFAAALFLASTAVAHAGNSISFQIDGQRIRIETPRNCASLDCVTIVAPGLSKTPITLKNINLNGLGSKDDDDTPSTSTTAAQPAPAVQQPVQQAQPTEVQPAQVQPATPVAPAVAAPAATVAAAPSVDTTTPAPVAAPAPAPIASTAAPAPVAAAPVFAPTSPIGVWATEENKGNVRVEPCGSNLCGFAEKTNERILINMQPDGAKWSGRIHDPDSGRNYDSTIAMKGPNLLRVQGCAFGGMFCGGQTWKRVS